MVGHEDLQESFYSRIDGLKESIRKTDPEVLREQAYICFSNGCLLLSSYKQSKGAKGWSARLQDENGLPMLSGSQQAAIEQTFENAPWLLKTLESRYDGAQVGGADDTMPKDLRVSGIIPSLEGFKLTGDDVSLDNAYRTMKKKSTEFDTFWDGLASAGPYKAWLDSEDFKVPKTPFTPEFPLPKRAVATLLVTLLDSIRLSYGIAGQKSSLLTFISMIEEALSGQWRQMIMTSLGFFSPSGMAMGVIGKYLANAFDLMEDRQREETLDTVYRTSKSLIVGFVLWGVSVLPPETVRKKISDLLETFNGKVKGMSEKIKLLEDTASVSLKPLGKRAKFTSIDLSKYKFTLQDLKNIQILAKWPVIICTNEFQDLIRPMLQEPGTRIALELMDIPSSSEATALVCKSGIRDLSEGMQYELSHPDIVDIGPGPGLEAAQGVQDAITGQLHDVTDQVKGAVGDAAGRVEGAIGKAASSAERAISDLNDPREQRTRGGARKAKPIKLKKSTRFRKATPRRATRGTKHH